MLLNSLIQSAFEKFQIFASYILREMLGNRNLRDNALIPFLIHETQTITQSAYSNIKKTRTLTSRRKSFVGKTIPTPTELWNDSKNWRKEKFWNSFSVSLARFPAPAKMCPWTPRSLNNLIGRSKERSAKAATARSPPRKSLRGKLEFSSLVFLLICLIGSLVPSPVVLDPQMIVGPAKVQIGEKSTPKKNLSGKGEGLFKNPQPHGNKTPPKIPKLSAA